MDVKNNMIIKKIGTSNEITIATEGSEQIQAKTETLEDTYQTTIGYQTVHLYCDGSNWYDLNY